MDKKTIVKYRGAYCILIPVYYDFENSPSWRKYFTGTQEECKNIIDGLPDSLKASSEENKKARENKIKEMLFLFEIGKTEKAKQIQRQYNL